MLPPDGHQQVLVSTADHAANSQVPEQFLQSGDISEKQQLAPAASWGDGGSKSFQGRAWGVPFIGQLSPDAAAQPGPFNGRVQQVRQNKRFKRRTVWGKVNGRMSLRAKPGLPQLLAQITPAAPLGTVQS